MREISIPGLAALLAFPLAACASVHEDYEGVGYTIYTDFRVESSVTDSEGLPEGAVGWFGSSPVYEEKSQHPGYLAFILKDGESRGILLKTPLPSSAVLLALPACRTASTRRRTAANMWQRLRISAISSAFSGS